MKSRTRAGTSGLTSSALWRRGAATCGALFTTSILIGDDSINRAGEPPGPWDRGDDSLGRVEDYLARAADAVADGTYWVGRGIGTLALIALLVFCVYVARLMGLRESSAEVTSGIARSAGVIAAGLGLVSCTAQFAVVSRANDGIDPEVARALLDFSGLTFVAMWLPIAVFMAAVAVSGRRHSLVPRWFAVTSGLLAAALFVGLATLPLGNAGFMAIMLGFLWFIAASVVLIRRVGHEDDGAAGILRPS